MLDTIIYIPTILAYAFITLLVVILSFIVVYVSHKIYISVYDNLPVPVLHSSSSLDDQSSTEKNEAVVFERSSANSILAKQAQIVRKSKSALRIIVSLEPCYLAYVVFETRKTANIIVPAHTEAPSTATTTESATITAAATATEITPAPPTSTATVSAIPTVTTTNSMQTISSSCDCMECNGDNADNITDTNSNNNNTTTTNNNNNNNKHNNHKRSSSQQQDILEASNILLGKNKYIKYYDRLSAIPHGKVMQTCPHPTTEITGSGREIRRPDLTVLSNVYDSIANRRIRMSSIR